MKFLFCLSLSLFSLVARAELETVPYVDVSRYLGDWYQISSNPMPFDTGCRHCVRQRLTLREDGNVGVYNSCNDSDANGPLRDIRGFATNDDPKTNARFTVDFNLPQKGKYWVIGLDKDYRYAVVSDPSMRSLYILSKTPELSTELYNEAVGQASRQLDTSKLAPAFHQGCSYPQ